MVTTPLAYEGSNNEKVAAVDECSRGLALGICHTRDFMDDEMGTLVMVRVVRDGVLQAMSQAGLTKDDVHFVQVKRPLSRLGDTGYKSMAMSRGASSLGVAAALEEIDESVLTNGDIGVNFDLYSNVASASAGLELRNCEILVLGNSDESQSDSSSDTA
jgi:cyanuric acid amidohydrolase